MTSPRTVRGRDRLRLFCGLRLPDDALDRLVSWQQAELADADVRLVTREHLHVTLAFLGSRPADDVPAIVDVLRAAVAAAETALLQAVRYRETRSVGMVVLAETDDRAARFADDLQRRLAELGVYEREARPWLPHVTVVRFRSRPRLDPAPPDLGVVSPSDAALYNSVLRSTGAQYVILESVALGGT
ncbi:MAG TPA: RNA 2',3'-cyclic phosphodiesterase [Gaiellaceae bacterium]